MKELSDNEIQWLEAFAKKHEFFASFQLHYNLKKLLSNNQYYWLRLYINQAEEQGDKLLNTEDISYLKENSESSKNLHKILEIYEKLGYLDKSNYEIFLELKLGATRATEKTKPSVSHYTHQVVKIPCPHCSFLCSPQISHCMKCGEPLPKLEKFTKRSGISDIPDDNYIEKNIIHSLEQLIGRPIPLTNEFNRSTNCYIKEGEEITGLSIFNCALTSFPSEILRCKHLKHLALRRNNIDKLPNEIGFLSNLENLDLRLNSLETLPNAIGLLINLKFLNISSNKLINVPGSIGELSMLKELNLSNNKLRSIPDCIENLNLLETLNLKANYWVQLPECIEKLKEQGLELIL